MLMDETGDERSRLNKHITTYYYCYWQDFFIGESEDNYSDLALVSAI